MSDTLVSEAFTQVKGEIEQEAGDLARRFGTTYVSDGATTTDRTPVLNLLGVSGGLVQFIKATDCRGRIKNSEYIADFIVKAILELESPYLVVQVLMDNATRSSWPLIEKACPWVSCAPCMPHVLDLELEDYYKAFDWVKDVVEQTKTLRKFVYKHQATLAAFQEVAESMMAMPAGTRFATCGILLSTALKNKKPLGDLFNDSSVYEFARKYRNNTNEAGETLWDRYTTLRMQVADMEYWERVESVVNLFAPVTRLLRLCDSDGPSASKVYYGQYVVQEELGKLDLPFMTEAEAKACREKAHAIHMARWEYGFSPIHATGYLLDPEFRLMHDDIIIPEINEGFMKMVDKTFPLPDGPVDPCSSVDRAKHEAACEEQANKRAAAEEQVQ